MTLDRTRLWTFEKIHEKTAPYCIRGDGTYNAITYKWWRIRRMGLLFAYPEVWGRSWYKMNPTEIWLN